MGFEYCILLPWCNACSAVSLRCDTPPEGAVTSKQDIKTSTVRFSTARFSLSPSRGFQSRCSPSFLVFSSAFLLSFRFAVTHIKTSTDEGKNHLGESLVQFVFANALNHSSELKRKPRSQRYLESALTTPLSSIGHEEHKAKRILYQHFHLSLQTLQNVTLANNKDISSAWECLWKLHGVSHQPRLLDRGYSAMSH